MSDQRNELDKIKAFFLNKKPIAYAVGVVMVLVALGNLTDAIPKIYSLVTGYFDAGQEGGEKERVGGDSQVAQEALPSPKPRVIPKVVKALESATVRSEPGVNSGSVVCNVHAGASLEVIESGRDWVRVRRGKTCNGWVLAARVRCSAEP
jgi:hypothetical protein